LGGQFAPKSMVNLDWKVVVNLTVFSTSPHKYSDQNYTIYSNVLEISGTFNELLETAYEFEKHFTYSKVVSTEFFTVKKGSDKKELHLIIIFQNYENRN
jgi:hypothetical protein